MPKYRFKDNEMKFSDIMDIFEQFEDAYVEIGTENGRYSSFAEELHLIITDCNEDIEMSNIEMYDEEKNGAIVFSIRSKYKCLRAVEHTKVKIRKQYYAYHYNVLSHFKLYDIANAYLDALEYFFTYSYMVRDEVKQEPSYKFGYIDTNNVGGVFNEVKQEPNSKFGYIDTDNVGGVFDDYPSFIGSFAQSNPIPCDGEDTGV